MSITSDRISLAQWRRDVAELYSSIRKISQKDPALASQIFRNKRNELFAKHHQSPLTLSQRNEFQGLKYFPYDDAFRTVGTLNRVVKRDTLDTKLGADGQIRYTPVARIEFELLNTPFALVLYWIEGYGGGLFLPFRDLSNGTSTYMAGRYLFDTIKGVDLGVETDTINLDFNFAYNPSCAYNENWICPLPPPENQIPTSIEAGEKTYMV